MASRLRWPDALLLGIATSMRTAAAPGMLALRGRITGRPRGALVAFGLGELAFDKTSVATNRTDPPALAARVAAAAYSGQSIAGPAGAVLGGLGAGAGTYATFRARRLAVKATGIADPALAVGEDIIAYTCAAYATRPEPESSPDGPPTSTADGVSRVDGATEGGVRDAPPERSFVRDAAKGVVAGLAGTALMSIAQGAEFMLTDAEPSTLPFEVAQKISKRTGRGRIRRRHRSAVNQGMHWLYGTSWGIPYGVVAASSSTAPELTGPIFGLLVWGAGMAHEPALGLSEPPWKRSLESLASEAFFHVVYGVGAAAALRALRNVG